MNQHNLTIQKPLTLITNPAGVITAQAGKNLKLKVTVFNEGYKNVLVNVYIENIKYKDSTSGINLGRLPSPQRLGLNPGQSGEVEIEIDIPRELQLGLYEYLLIVDAPAPEHYPENRVEHTGTLLVKSFIQSSNITSDPTFSLEPYSSSSKPIPINVGEKLEIKVKVDNRSQRVDRFSLSCPDLNLIWADFPQDNCQIKYLKNSSGSKLLSIANSLELNPGEEGEIVLELTVPKTSMAGIHSPTIRLYSNNQPHLVLLDIFHIKVSDVYLLDIAMLTKVGKVKNLPGLFQLQFYNQGNTLRKLKLNVDSTDQEKLCTYILDAETISLLPGGSKNVNLKVQLPQSWWRRPFYGKLFNFIVEIEDSYDVPLINNRFPGALIWESRPWWHFLLLALLILGVIVTGAVLVWWLLLKPKPIPAIVQFYPESIFYKEINNDAVQLNWQITELNKLKNIKITGFSPDGTITSAPVVYDFQEGIPKQLQQLCTNEQQILNCQNVITDARKSGSYNFELTIFYQQGKEILSKSLKTNKIIVEPIPQPQITLLASTKPVYEENSVDNKILLNWEINHPEQIQNLTLIGKSSEGGIPSLLQRYDINTSSQLIQQYCQITSEKLICKNIPTATKPGNYIFELAVIPKYGKPEKIESKKTDLIKIKSPAPIISEFKIAGEDAKPTYVFPLVPGQEKSLAISWKVIGNKNTKIELLPAPGTVPQQGNIDYSLSSSSTKSTITLQAISESGEKVSRSTIIETVLSPTLPLNTSKSGGLPVSPSLSPKPFDGNQSKNNPNLPSVKPSVVPPLINPVVNDPESNSLPPAELPPQAQ
ncbi:MAG: hypothetical protein ACK5ER_03095 [Aphanizomenon sp.]|jgi:hypothetical protein